MAQGKQFALIDLDRLKWPSSFQLPSRRFRLFVAADSRRAADDAIAEFAHDALKRGMVYFCAWGPDCSRFHDVVDQVIVADDIGERAFAGPNEGDTIMTTWHENDSLEQALEFFATCAAPTDGLVPDSDFRLVICIGNQAWAQIAAQFLHTAEFFV